MKKKSSSRPFLAHPAGEQETTSYLRVAPLCYYIFKRGPCPCLWGQKPIWYRHEYIYSWNTDRMYLPVLIPSFPNYLRYIWQQLNMSLCTFTNNPISFWYNYVPIFIYNFQSLNVEKFADPPPWKYLKNVILNHNDELNFVRGYIDLCNLF